MLKFNTVSFIGGGSVAIHITKKYPHLDIWVNDLYEPLVNFWQQLQMFGYDLKSELVDLKTANNTPDKARELLNQMAPKVLTHSLYLGQTYTFPHFQEPA